MENLVDLQSTITNPVWELHDPNPNPNPNPAQGTYLPTYLT